MNEGLIPRRYAKALYKVAVERGCDKRLYAMMATLITGFARNDKLQPTIANPFVSDTEKVGLLSIAAGATSDDVTFCDFLKLLVENRRISFMREIALAYQHIYRKANSIYIVNVTSAAPLEKTETDRLNKLILKHLPEGSSIELATDTDPSLIGGFVVSIDNERLDASIKNELKQLRLKLIS